MAKHGITIGLLLCLTACGPPEPGPELFDHAEALCLEGKWVEAQAPLRQYLTAHPEHAGAHFYLGRAYLFGNDFRPAVSEGELQLALKLYEENGKQSPIERFPNEYFEIICNLESAKVLIKLVVGLQAEGVPPAALQDLVNRMRIYLEKARAIEPDTPDIKNLDSIVRGFEQLTGMSPPPGSPSDA